MTDLAPLHDFEEEISREAKEPWVIRDAGSVNWTFERIAESEAQVASIEAQKAEAIRRIEERAAKLEEQARARRGYFFAKLAEYAQRERAFLTSGRRRSYDFLSGRLGWRAHKARLKVIDKTALADWLVTQPVELSRVKVEPEMLQLQALFATTGEIPPGCEVEEAHEDFYIQPHPLEMEPAPEPKELEEP
jgi:phage host-nuclease inhibitor protein Gam